MATINGPIVYLEHDTDDQEHLIEVLQTLKVPNTLKIFNDCKSALEYLKVTKDRIFLIISDVKFPGMDGFGLREEIIKDDYLRKKAIPYIFLTDYADKQSIDKAYELEVQGFFEKEGSIIKLGLIIKQIIDYWENCKHPNSYK